MKTLIAIILILAALTSCGRSNNSGNLKQSNPQLVYLQCSHVQVEASCLDYADDVLIESRFFYYYSCYEQYTQCLISLGVM